VNVIVGIGPRGDRRDRRARRDAAIVRFDFDVDLDFAVAFGAARFTFLPMTEPQR
jgi:hypothetical protein